MTVGLLRHITVFLAMIAMVQVAHGASAVHKCMINGTVTFQSGPCPSDVPSRRPTKDELNAERKKQLAKSAPKAASATTGANANATQTQTPTQAARDPGFRCDGRQYCSQMRSCDEAKYFLANCPGAKMDGNRDGRPCEQQWCLR